MFADTLNIVREYIRTQRGQIAVDANLLRRQHGYALRDAVITAGTRRLRPILMTTVTTVLGLVPMALGIGEGGELQAPMARVVIGGLTTSTLITLVVIPVVYMSLEERSERARARRAEPPADALQTLPHEPENIAALKRRLQNSLLIVVDR